jgi:hypothetical protein
MATEINAAAIAAATSPVLELANTPRALWIHDAVEGAGQTTDVYTVLRIYRGDEPGAFAGMRQPSVSVQADTRGVDGSAVLARAWAIHESLLEAVDGPPRLNWLFDGKRFNATSGAVEADPDSPGWHAWVKRLAAPGIIGRDGERRIATGNFDVEFQLQDEA